MELIDRDMLKEVVEDNDEAISDEIHRWGRGMFTENIHKVIDAQPTVEAEPVKHGEWKRIGNCHYKCSTCGENIMTSSLKRFNYCLYCGAKMDGGKDERL